LVDAVSSPFSIEWTEAMEKELQAMSQNNVWDRIPQEEMPKRVKPLANKWVYTIKDNPDGDTKAKAWLVIKGFLQRDGKDYYSANILAPVVYLRTIQTAMAVLAGVRIHKMDVKTASLNALLDKEIFMHLSEGYDREDSGEISTDVYA
jgi:hypothetical protein